MNDGRGKIIRGMDEEIKERDGWKKRLRKAEE